MLILFDIDGTLLISQRAGVRSMEEAGRELFGDHFKFDGIDYSGRLDPWIWGELARLNGVADADGLHDKFKDVYARRLEERLRTNPTARALPGVQDLLAALRKQAGVTLGLLTGNYAETGRLKVSAAGIDVAQFRVAAWGADGRTRRDLPPVAMRRYEEQVGTRLAPEQVVILGDTPHDIDCARAHGCRSLGVGTGGKPLEELRQCGADYVAEDLSDTAAILAWLIQPQPRHPGGVRRAAPTFQGC